MYSYPRPIRTCIRRFFYLKNEKCKVNKAKAEDNKISQQANEANKTRNPATLRFLIKKRTATQWSINYNQTSQL